MHNLDYKIILDETDIDIPQLIQIFQTPEIARYLSISDNYFRYVTTNENVCLYKVYKGTQLVGTIHLEKQAAVLFIAILVFPQFHRTGLGTKIVRDIQNDIFGMNYERIEIDIDESNIASLRLFENAGFIRTSQEDELINFVYQRRTD